MITTVPAACAGLVTLTDVAMLPITVPAVVPNVTFVTFVRTLPVMATVVPPTVVPEVGVKLVIAGVEVASATEETDRAPAVTPKVETSNPATSLNTRLALIRSRFLLLCQDFQ